jgi:mono/diheme cytochrome c family protein
MREKSEGPSASARFVTMALVLAPSLCVAGASDPQNFTEIERGRYLAVVADCSSCHTMPNDGAAFAGGRAIETPFGNLRAPNITPDRDTGIGTWTDDEFDAAVRRGIRPNGARLYPAMPFNAYTKMSRGEVLAIRAFLNTVPAVRNSVVANELPFPYSVRAVMGVWDGLYFNQGEYQPDPQKSAEWNRGAYLVSGPGHCGACHTPKSSLGGDEKGRLLEGSPLQGWFAPNITGDGPRGLGQWSVEDIVSYLKSGHNRMSAATGPMAEVVALSTSKMTVADLRAMAFYLKAVPGPHSSKDAPLNADSPMMRAGSAIYHDECSACHGLEGRGAPLLFPSLTDSSLVRAQDPATLVRIVLRGARSVATAAEPTGPGMPAYGWQLDDTQVAAVLTYVRNSWGSAAPAVAAETVTNSRAELASRPD